MLKRSAHHDLQPRRSKDFKNKSEGFRGKPLVYAIRSSAAELFIKNHQGLMRRYRAEHRRRRPLQSWLAASTGRLPPRSRKLGGDRDAR